MRVHHVGHSKGSRDPSFELFSFYGSNLSMKKKHIPNTLIGVRCRIKIGFTENSQSGNSAITLK